MPRQERETRERSKKTFQETIEFINESTKLNNKLNKTQEEKVEVNILHKLIKYKIRKEKKK